MSATITATITYYPRRESKPRRGARTLAGVKLEPAPATNPVSDEDLEALQRCSRFKSLVEGDAIKVSKSKASAKAPAKEPPKAPASSSTEGNSKTPAKSAKSS